MYSLAMKCLSIVSLLAPCIAAASQSGKVLKTAALPRYFGAALAVGHLQNSSDPLFRTFAAIQFSGATPENEMKWEIIEPFQNQFDFTQGDSVRDFSVAHGFKLRGHTLVWHK
jgi:endo-1,4-beta-xylanase